MTDDVRIYAELESSLYGAALHVLRVCGQAVDANLSVCHTFGAAAASQDTAVDITHGSLHGLREHLMVWPRSEMSIFRHAQKARIYDDGCRATRFLAQTEHDLAFTPNGAGQPLPLADHYCMTATLMGHTWAMLFFAKVDTSQPFTAGQINLLERLRPTATRVLRNGHFRDLHASDPEAARSFAGQIGGLTARPTLRRLTPREIYHRLSSAERVVLDMLRSSHTERDIAETLHRSPHTVHAHVKSIYRKLDINSRRELRSLFPQNDAG
jgi:DNA-binding CsgD family transcriptional regulator